MSSAGRPWGEEVTEKLVWHVVKEFAAKTGVSKLAPHDLRRYAESRTMPNPFGNAPFGGGSESNLDHRIRHSPKESEALQKSQQLVVGLIPSAADLYRHGFGEGFLLDGEIGLQVDLRCFDGFVTQPECY